MHDRFLSRHIANSHKHAHSVESSVSGASTSSSDSDYADQKLILTQIKDSLDTWTTLANTAGALTTGASSLPSPGDMQRIAEKVEETESSQKGYGTLVGLLLSVIAAFIWYVRKRSQQRKSHDEIKKELNAWYSRFSVASQACQDIATVAFTFLPPVFSPFKRLIAYVVGTVAGFIAVLITRSSSKDTPNPLFTLGGTEGWSSYIYTGSSIGAMVGAAIGAIIGLLIPIPFTMPACIALFTALGGLTGALITGIGVPLINKLFPEVNTKYRLNYAKTGALLGSTLGGIIGFVVGLFIPIPGAAVACATIGMGIGAAIGAIGMAIAGPAITKKIDEKEDSNWDYSTRYAGTAGNGIGTVIGFGFEKLQEGSQQLAANIGTLITSAIGFVYDLWTTYKKKNEPSPVAGAAVKEEKESLPWSQRVNLFAAIGTATGSVVGFFIGGPVGMIIGGAIGAVVGSVVGIAAGNYLCRKILTFGNWLTNKIDALCCDPKNNEPEVKKGNDNKPLPLKTTSALQKRSDVNLPRAVSAPILIPGKKQSDSLQVPFSQPALVSQNGLWAHRSFDSSADALSQSCPGFHHRVGI